MSIDSPPNTPLDSPDAVASNARDTLVGSAFAKAASVFTDSTDSQETAAKLGTEFVKVGALFVQGRLGFVTSAAAYALGEVKIDDMANAGTDATLGALKGLATKGTFSVMGARFAGFETPLAVQAVGLSVANRTLDAGLTRSNLFSADGNLDLGRAAKAVGSALDSKAIAADAGIMLVAGGLMSKGVNNTLLGGRNPIPGLMERSPGAASTLGGATFGFASGAGEEITRQVQSENRGLTTINWGSVFNQGAIHAGIDAAAARAGHSFGSRAVETAPVMRPSRAEPVVEYKVDRPDPVASILSLDPPAGPRITRADAKDRNRPQISMMPGRVLPDLAREVVQVNGQILKRGQELKVGRYEWNDIQYGENDLSVGRAHGAIGRLNDGRLYFREDTSTFGTTIDGKKIKPGINYEIRPDADIRLGARGTRLNVESFGMPPEVRIGGVEIDLTKGETPLGRGRMGIENPHVSADHGVMGTDGKGLYIVDYSRNGTWVNDVRIAANKRVYLKEGDKVRLGGADRVPVEIGSTFEPLRMPEKTTVLRLPDGHVPSPQAIRQANEYAKTERQSARLEPGFQNAGADAVIDAKGNHDRSSRPSTVFDPARDPVLRETFAQVHARFDHLRSNPMKLAKELTKYAHEKLEGNAKDIDTWYDKFNDRQGGQRVLLGEFIKQNKGVCSQQALLLKVLADEMGLRATMVRGMDGRHAWTEMDIDGQHLIFDPRWQILGEPPANWPKHVRY